MRMFACLAVLLATGPVLREPAPPPGQRRGDQVEAFEARRQGRLMPLREIERRIVPRIPGAQYLGVELDDGIYTFKFLRDGDVVWILVDGRSGRVLREFGQ